jgi:thioredoxin-like negative regulator of GroEL
MQVLRTAESCQRALEETSDSLLVFSATWCGPCQALKPHLEQVAHTSMHVLYVDIDEVPEFATEFNVTSVPTVFLRRGGKIVALLKGSRPQALRAMVRDYLQSLQTPPEPASHFGDINTPQELESKDPSI